MLSCPIYIYIYIVNGNKITRKKISDKIQNIIQSINIRFSEITNSDICF